MIYFKGQSDRVRPNQAGRLQLLQPILNLIRMSISEKYDFSTKITTQMQLAVTSQSNCVVIFVANWIGDFRNRISPKYSPRLNRDLGPCVCWQRCADEFVHRSGRVLHVDEPRLFAGELGNPSLVSPRTLCTSLR